MYQQMFAYSSHLIGRALCALTTVVVSLYTSVNVSASDMECKAVAGKGTQQSFQEQCEFDGTAYDLCINMKLFSRDFSSHDAYGNYDWFIDLGSLGFPVPEGSTTNYNREFNVLTSDEGMVFGDVQYAFDDRIFESHGGFVAPMIVTGGTGMYDGATGWVAFMFIDETIEKQRFFGRICGPGIQRAE